MAVYTKEYESQPEAILTNVIICPAVDLSANVAVPVHCQVENVLWDTGATNTLISQEVVNALGLQRDNSDITELDIKNFSYSSEDLSGPLVGGATKTALLLSVNKQKFIIKNPYLKTDVYDMIDFLRLIGKKIDISDNSIVCSGNVMASSNQYIEFNLTQCISEIITYSTLALINNTNLTFLDLNKKTISLTLKPEI